MKVRETTSDRIVRVVIYIILTGFGFLCLYPLYVVLISSFSDPGAVAQGKVTIIPVDLTLDAYIEAFRTDDILIGYRNSLFYTMLRPAKPGFSSSKMLTSTVLPTRTEVLSTMILPPETGSGSLSSVTSNVKVP